jgi:chromosome segregation ATPase
MPASGTRDCTDLEKKLAEIDQRIALAGLESRIRHAQNGIDAAHSWAETNRGLRGTPQADAIKRIYAQPGSLPAHLRQMLADLDRIEKNISRADADAKSYTEQLKKLEGDLATEVAELGPIAGEDHTSANLADLDKMRRDTEDALLRCYSETQAHVNGRPHDPKIPYAGGFICWCGKDHGPHSFIGMTTCWCGVYNEGVGVPR